MSPLHKCSFCAVAGVVESVLARVMDAFQVRMQAALMSCSVKALSESAALTRLMAAEPAAPSAGDPVAFFTGRQSDNVDAFVTDVINAGRPPFRTQPWSNTFALQ